MTKWHAHVAHMAKHMEMVGGPGHLAPPLNPALLLQPHRIVVANFVPGNFGLFRRNPWQPLAEPWGSAETRLKNTAVQ